MLASRRRFTAVARCLLFCWLAGSALPSLAQSCPATLAAPPACDCPADGFYAACNDLVPGSAGPDDAVAINRCFERNPTKPEEPICKCAQLREAVYRLRSPIVITGRPAEEINLDGARLLGLGRLSKLRVDAGGDACNFPADGNDGTGLTYSPAIEVTRASGVILNSFQLDISDLRQRCSGKAERTQGFAIRFLSSVSTARVTDVRIVGEPFVENTPYSTGGGGTGGIQITGAANSVLQGNRLTNIGFLKKGGSSGVAGIQVVNSANSCVAQNRVTNVAFGIEVVNFFSNSPRTRGDSSGSAVASNTIVGASGISGCNVCSGGRGIKLQACAVGFGNPPPPPMRNLRVEGNSVTSFGGERAARGLQEFGSGLDLICGVQFSRFAANTIDGSNTAAQFGLQLRSSDEGGSVPPLVYDRTTTTHHNTFENNSFNSGDGGAGCSNCVDLNINSDAPDQINVSRSLPSGTAGNTFGSRRTAGPNRCSGSLFSEAFFSPNRVAPTGTLQLSARGIKPNTDVTFRFVGGDGRATTSIRGNCTPQGSVGVSQLGLIPGDYQVFASYTDGNSEAGRDREPAAQVPVEILEVPLGTLTISDTLPPPSNPLLTVAPSSLSFSATAGGVSQLSQSLSVGSTGAAISFSTADDASWLTVSSATGTTPASLSAVVNTSGLPAGSYSATIMLTGQDAANSPVSIPVSLTLSAAPGLNLTTSPTSHAFSGTVGGANPAPQALRVDSSGDPRSFSISEDAPWLLVSPGFGVTGDSVSVAVNLTGLAAGTYNAVLTISAAGASNSPLAVPVTLTVSPPPPALPRLNVSVVSISLLITAGGANPPDQTFTVRCNEAPLAFGVASSASWLSATPASGTTNAMVTASVNAAGFAPGTYTATLTVSAAGATNSPVNVPVTLVVNAPGGGVTVNPTSLAFTASPGGPNPEAQSLFVSGVTGNTFAAASNATWLSVVPASSFLPGIASVAVEVSGLALGTYNGTVTLTSPGLSARLVPVTLTVTPPVLSLTLSPRQLVFNGFVGLATPLTGALTIGSTGSRLSWTASTDAPWLSVVPASGQTPANATVQADAGSLAPGTYRAMITISASGTSPAQVMVELAVSNAPAILTVSPPSLVFSTQRGSFPATQSLRVESPLTSGVSWRATTTVPWLQLGGGGMTPGTAFVNLTDAGVALAPGTYQGVIFVESTDRTTTVAVPVSLTVSLTAAPPPRR